MVPPVPSLQKPSTLPHQLAVSSGQPGSLQHAVPHQASMVDAGNGVHQHGAAAFDQGMGVRWGQPTSPATGNSPGIPASEWVAYGQPQSFGGHGSMLNPQGSTAGVMGQAQHQGGLGGEGHGAGGTSVAASLVRPPGLVDLINSQVFKQRLNLCEALIFHFFLNMALSSRLYSLEIGSRLLR